MLVISIIRYTERWFVSNIPDGGQQYGEQNCTLDVIGVATAQALAASRGVAREAAAEKQQQQNCH